MAIRKRNPLQKVKNPLTEFSQAWILEPLQEDESFTCKKMFGGLAAYFHGRMVVCLMESDEDPVWRGVLFPTDRAHHESLQKQWPSLTPHKILGKWLYLPMNDAEYEATAMAVIERIRRGDERLGIEPKARRKSTKKKTSKKTKKKSKKS